jgi:hypothetical protein
MQAILYNVSAVQAPMLAAAVAVMGAVAATYRQFLAGATPFSSNATPELIFG